MIQFVNFIITVFVTVRGSIATYAYTIDITSCASTNNRIGGPLLPPKVSTSQKGIRII